MTLKSIAICSLLLATLSACNTVAGAGQDISTAGDAISDTSRDVESDL